MEIALELIEIALLVYIIWPVKKSAVRQFKPTIASKSESLCQMVEFRYSNGAARAFHTNPTCRHHNTDKAAESLTPEFGQSLCDATLAQTFESTHLVER